MKRRHLYTKNGGEESHNECRCSNDAEGYKTPHAQATLPLFTALLFLPVLFWSQQVRSDVLAHMLLLLTPFFARNFF